MNYLIDTKAVSEYMKKQPNQKVLNWFDAQIEESLYLSVLTIGEIEKGIAKIADPIRKTNYENFLQRLIYRFDARILPVDVRTVRRWGMLCGELELQGRVLPLIDSLIAATALEHDLTVITRNAADFADTGAKTLNIWDG
jgi:toxin FitB